MVTLNIHWEVFEDSDFRQIKSLAVRGPLAISISPWQIPRMSEEQKKWLTNLLKDERYVLGQQGLNHKCSTCSEFHVQRKEGKIVRPGIDPWHENYCLWFGQISEDEQERLMVEGRKQLHKAFGVNAQLYAPPNHYLGKNTTLVASRIGYKWITNKAKVLLKPYTVHDIIIIPEGEPEIQGNQNIYIHSDRWGGNLEKAINNKLTSLLNIKPQKNTIQKIAENRRVKAIEKIARDLHTGFGMPKENAIVAAELLYETKFKKDPFI